MRMSDKVAFGLGVAGGVSLMMNSAVSGIGVSATRQVKAFADAEKGFARSGLREATKDFNSAYDVNLRNNRGYAEILASAQFANEPYAETRVSLRRDGGSGAPSSGTQSSSDSGSLMGVPSPSMTSLQEILGQEKSRSVIVETIEQEQQAIGSSSSFDGTLQRQRASMPSRLSESLCLAANQNSSIADPLGCHGVMSGKIQPIAQNLTDAAREMFAKSQIFECNLSRSSLIEDLSSSIRQLGDLHAGTLVTGVVALVAGGGALIAKSMSAGGVHRPHQDQADPPPAYSSFGLPQLYRRPQPHQPNDIELATLGAEPGLEGASREPAGVSLRSSSPSSAEEPPADPRQMV